jgi:hypothetical protein
MKSQHDQQQRVLGRVLAQGVGDGYAAQAAGGATLPNLDNPSGSSTSLYTAGPTPQIRDINNNYDWPTT